MCKISVVLLGGYSGFQVTGDNRKSFLSLKFSIPEFFGVGRFGLKVFWGGGGALIQVKICFDSQNKLKICDSACVLCFII